MPIGDFPEMLSQRILAGIILVGRFGVSGVGRLGPWAGRGGGKQREGTAKLLTKEQWRPRCGERRGGGGRRRRERGEREGDEKARHLAARAASGGGRI